MDAAELFSSSVSVKDIIGEDVDSYDSQYLQAIVRNVRRIEDDLDIQKDIVDELNCASMSKGDVDDKRTRTICKLLVPVRKMNDGTLIGFMFENCTNGSLEREGVVVKASVRKGAYFIKHVPSKLPGLAQSSIHIKFLIRLMSSQKGCWLNIGEGTQTTFSF